MEDNNRIPDTEPLISDDKKSRPPRVHVVDEISPKSSPLLQSFGFICGGISIPLSASFFMLASSIVSWALAASLGHVTGIPRISQCGVIQPERTVLGLGYVLVGFSFVRLSRLVHWFMIGALPESQHFRYLALSLSLLCGFTSLGIAVAPFSFDEDETSLDELTCVLFLSFSLLCLLIHIALQTFDTPLGKIQSALVICGVLFAVLFVALKVAGWDKNIRAALEWLCVFSLCGYMFTVHSEVRDDVSHKQPRVSADTMKSVV